MELRLVNANEETTMDPLRIEPDYMGFCAYYDPEGPVGRGKTKEDALHDLIIWCIEDDHMERLVMGSIVAAIAPEKSARGGEISGPETIYDANGAAIGTRVTFTPNPRAACTSEGIGAGYGIEGQSGGTTHG
jgi:hypothetical protein